MLTSCSGPDPVEVQKAKELCEDLLKNVREQYEEFKNNLNEHPDIEIAFCNVWQT